MPSKNEFERIVTLYQAKDFDGVCRIARSLKPDGVPHIGIVSKVAKSFHRKRRYAEASEWYRRLIVLRSGDGNARIQAKVFYNTGIVHWQLKDWPQAEAAFRKAWELGKEEAAQELAEVLIEQDRHQEALEILLQATGERDHHYHYQVGLCYHWMENTAMSVRHFEEAHRLEPADPAYLACLVDELEFLGRWEDIIKYQAQVDEVLENPECGRQWFGKELLWTMGKAAYATENDFEALKYYRLLVVHPLLSDSEKKVVYYNMGSAHWNLDEIEEARDCYEEAISLGDEDARQPLIDCLDILLDPDCQES